MLTCTFTCVGIISFYLSLSPSSSPPLPLSPPPPPLPLQVYTDWANNRLKKAGLTNVQVSDLQKDIPDGYILPKIIQAVGMCIAIHSLTHSLIHLVHEEVPGILSSPDNEDECVRRQPPVLSLSLSLCIICNNLILITFLSL